MHLLHDLVDKHYVEGWPQLANELQRIGRLKRIAYNNNSVHDNEESRMHTEDHMQSLGWEKMYDFCERLHRHMTREVGTELNGSYYAEVSRSEVQNYVSQELNLLFEEEHLAFEFRDGIVQRQGRHHTVERISKAQMILGARRLKGARDHFNKALGFYRNVAPDYENAVKDAVCTVEAAGKVLFPEAKAKTLGDLANWLPRHLDVPKTIGKTIENIYAYRSGGEGIAHGGTAGGRATAEIAEYVLSVCASQVIYFFDLASARKAKYLSERVGA